MAKISVIVVTHESGNVLGRCLEAINRQSTGELEVVVVDSGSRSSAYLDAAGNLPGVVVERVGNIGFSRANNLGFNRSSKTAEFVLFLNPDAFLAGDALNRAVDRMKDDPEVGCLTGKLLGYDVDNDLPTGLIDTTGIIRKWYGRWIDRGQGEPDRGQYDKREYMSAACGAFLFCRRRALEDIIDHQGNVFDPSFFMYKEDIELSLRLRRRGWRILYAPQIEVYHCRGWNKDRRAMPLSMRLMAAGNEMLLYRRHPSPYILWALLKYLVVRWLGR